MREYENACEYSSLNNQKVRKDEDKNIWLIVLAAGLSSRMGDQKLSLPIGEDPLLKTVVKKACSSKADGINVVLNTDHNNLATQISELPVNIVWNEKAELGLSSSLRVGMGHLPDKVQTTGILLGDQPGISIALLDELIDSHIREKVLITQPRYKDGPGHPVLFDQLLFPEIMNIQGDKGGRGVIEKHKSQRLLLPVLEKQPVDIDTKLDYEQYMQKR